MATPLINRSGCSNPDETGVLSVDRAREHIVGDINPVTGYERVATRSALSRILAEDVVSPVDVPAHTNSAMDGYAVAGADLPSTGTRELTVIGTAWAGTPFSDAVRPGQAVRIMTGGKMPQGADTVIMQEHVEGHGEKIRIGTGHRVNQNVRAAGEDLARGETALRSGMRLLPAELGLIASLGFGEVNVRPQPRVAFFSTGDELRSIGETLEEGQIYDSNRYTLYGMLKRVGVDIVDMGVIRDNPKAIQRAFEDAAQQCDAIITSGGVSVGAADYVKQTLETIGNIRFWKIAMKPGRPLAYGRIGDARFFGLPGNPVSVMVTFYQFVRPALQRMMGADINEDNMTFQVRSASRLRKRPGRTEFQRAVLSRGSDGGLKVSATGSQGSGILRSMSEANCFVILPHDSVGIEPGDLVEVQPFFGLV